MRTFSCNQCGLCCQHVNYAVETHFIDRGDGTCKHYDPTSKGCSIYAERPDICRVDRSYELHYQHLYTWDDYVELNLKVCVELQEKDRLLATSIIARSSGKAPVDI